MGELQDLLDDTEDQINRLPKAPDDDAQGEIITLVTGFSRELATYVEGTPDDNGIHQAIRPFNKAFFSEIRGTAPRFSPFARGESRCYTHPVFLPLDREPQVYVNGSDGISVDEVMIMGDK